jgi:hypothetical protein
MRAISRREFFTRAAGDAAAAGFLATAVANLRASPFGWPIGCQTFPVGKDIDKDFTGILRRDESGFDEAERGVSEVVERVITGC